MPSSSTPSPGWHAEIRSVIASRGWPWRCVSAGAGRDRVTFVAELANGETGESRRISISGSRFPTPQTRVTEILRQLDLL